MTTQQILIEIQEKQSLRETSKQAEKALVRDTLETLRLLTELFRQGAHDVMVKMSESENLEWDANLRRFVYHRGETSQFLELARKEILFRVRPYLKQLGSSIRSNEAAS